MIGALTACAALALLAPQGEGVRAWMEVAPRKAEVGQPLEWTLFVEHPAGLRVDFPLADPLDDDPTWSVIEPGRRKRVPADEPGRARTEARWTVMSLDSGERTLPAPDVLFEENGAQARVAARPATVTVAATLGEDEDVPRPPVGLRPEPEEVSLIVSSWPAALGAGLVGLVLVLILLAKRPRRKARDTSPTPASRLGRLLRQAEDDPDLVEQPDELRAFYFELAQVVRYAVDRRLGKPRQALSDDEWTRAIRRETELDEDLPETVEELLARCERVKYGAEKPTRFAVEEALEDSRQVLVSLVVEEDDEGPDAGDGNDEEARP